MSPVSSTNLTNFPSAWKRNIFRDLLTSNVIVLVDSAVWISRRIVARRLKARFRRLECSLPRIDANWPIKYVAFSLFSFRSSEVMRFNNSLTRFYRVI